VKLRNPKKSDNNVLAKTKEGVRGVGGGKKKKTFNRCVISRSNMDYL